MKRNYLKLIFTIIIFVFTKQLQAKRYERCEFLKILTEDHQISPQLAGTWTCLGEKISGLDQSILVKGINTTYNGIFQISSEYWCEETANLTGKGCDLNCNQLRDDNLNDDLLCAQKIYNQHSGFSAWPVYESACKDLVYQDYFKECDIEVSKVPNQNSKIYGKCELVKELHEIHGIPIEMLSTITCIAQEESQFNTAAIGRLNNDKSLDHGIFQISDKFWCLNDEDNDKAGNDCNLPCSSLRDDDITDDVRCMKQIYDRTKLFSESGFDAWLVYTKNNSICKNLTRNFIEECLHEMKSVTKPSSKSYQRCELAQKLKEANVPLDQIPSYVCIAYHESKLTTSKVSNDKYGIFQFKKGKWCSSNDITSVGCEMSCDRLKDTHIEDDIECAKKVHALLGFNGWSSYKTHCEGEMAQKFVESCSSDLKPTEKTKIESQSMIQLKESSSVMKPVSVPYYLLHFSDPENAIRATLEIGKSNLRDGAGIKVIPILSTKSPNKMNGLSVIIEDGK